MCKGRKISKEAGGAKAANRSSSYRRECTLLMTMKTTCSLMRKSRQVVIDVPVLAFLPLQLRRPVPAIDPGHSPPEVAQKVQGLQQGPPLDAQQLQGAAQQLHQVVAENTQPIDGLLAWLQSKLFRIHLRIFTALLNGITLRKFRVFSIIQFKYNQIPMSIELNHDFFYIAKPENVVLTRAKV